MLRCKLSQSSNCACSIIGSLWQDAVDDSLFNSSPSPRTYGQPESIRVFGIASSEPFRDAFRTRSSIGLTTRRLMELRPSRSDPHLVHHLQPQLRTSNCYESKRTIWLSNGGLGVCSGSARRLDESRINQLYTPYAMVMGVCLCVWTGRAFDFTLLHLGVLMVSKYFYALRHTHTLRAVNRSHPRRCFHGAALRFFGG